jgi:4,5:9,10-diseco-3-hydroxy-5,9,17-trioxoandrosta-1(10),2-diene-4-oate hydrolase
MGFTRQETSKFVKAGPIRMHYNEAGSGDPLICIHGGGPGATGWSNFSRNIDELAKHYRTIFVDLPGFGETDGMKIDGPLYGVLARSVRDFMDAMDIRRAHFIGNSLGGGTVVKFAMDYPDRADRLVLLGPGCGLPIFSHTPSEGIKHLFGFYEPPGPSIEKLKAFIQVMIYDLRANRRTAGRALRSRNPPRGDRQLSDQTRHSANYRAAVERHRVGQTQVTGAMGEG